MIIAILLGVACLLFLAALVSIMLTVRSVQERRPWIILAGSLSLLSLSTGFFTYTHYTSSISDSYSLAAGISILAAGLCSLFSVYILGQRYLAAQSHQASSSAELDRFRISFEKDLNLLMIKDQQLVYLSVNPAYAQFLGKNGEALTGKSDFDFFPRSQANAFRQDDERAFETGLPQMRVEELRGVEGSRWFRLDRIPLFDDARNPTGILVRGQDITPSKLLESRITENRQETITLQNALLALVAELQPPDLVEKMLIWAVRLGKTEHAAYWQIEPGQLLLQLRLGRGKLANFIGCQIRAGEDVPGVSWQTGQTTMIDDYPVWSNRSNNFQDQGFTAALGFPIRSKNQVVGTLCLYMDKPVHSFKTEQVELLEQFARFASECLHNAEQMAAYQKELDERAQSLAKLQYRLRLEHLVAAMAAHFIVAESARIDEEISRSLQSFAHYAGVDHAYMVFFSKTGGEASGQSLWYSSRKEMPPESSRVTTAEELRWLHTRLIQMETIHIPRLDELTSESEEASTYLRAKGVKSFTAVPLVSQRTVTGYLGLETTTTELEWSPDVLALLKICSEMYINVVERKLAAWELKVKQDELKNQIVLLEHSNQEVKMVTEMGDLLQACRTSDEAYPIVARYMQRLIQKGSGALYMIHDANDPAENVASWGEEPLKSSEPELLLNECWALRRGRTYLVHDPDSEPVCGHIKNPKPTGYVCIPLLAQGSAVGILHLRSPDTDPSLSALGEEQVRLATKVAEFIAIALTNLSLRDNLRSQAIRDPLTGLFNRRYMEETLEREIRRANRHNTSVGVIMFDIDRMKPINDRFGHDAGDALLRVLEPVMNFRAHGPSPERNS